MFVYVAVFDKRGDGKISVGRFRQIMKQVAGALTDAELDDMIHHADPHKTGLIDYDGRATNTQLET